MLDVAVVQSIIDNEPDAMLGLLMVQTVVLAQALHQAGACTKADIERAFKNGLQDALLGAPEITLDS